MKCAVAPCVLLLFSIFSAGQESALLGHVRDANGAAIANARVMIHWDSSGSRVGLIDNIGVKQDVVVTTDRKGHYSVALPPGLYDVFVSSDAFTPASAKVRVKRGTTVIHDVIMRLAPNVLRELGDVFPTATVPTRRGGRNTGH
jgi:hypothetical protein